MKMRIINIVALFAAAFGVLIVLQYRSVNHENKGFTRTIIDGEIKLVKVFEMPPSYFYLLDIMKDTLYFQNGSDNISLYKIDTSLSGLKSERVGFWENTDRRSTQVTLGITDSVVYGVENGTSKLFIKRKIGSKFQSFKQKNQIFNHARLISAKSIVGKSLDVNFDEPVRNITKISYNDLMDSKKLTLREKRGDYFETDGVLNYDATTAKLFYVYFYRGEIVCLDTNLNKLYRIKTIDATSTIATKLSTRALVNNGKKDFIWTNSKPPEAVNRNFVIHDDHLYVMSAVKSDDESISNFKNNQIVDVYSKNDGVYQHSFYIPKFKGIKLRSFRISQDYLYALFDSYLVKYRLGNHFIDKMGYIKK